MRFMSCVFVKINSKGIFKPNTLKKESIKYVSAEAQNKIFLNLNSNNFLQKKKWKLPKEEEMLK